MLYALIARPRPTSTLFPYTTLFRSRSMTCRMMPDSMRDVILLNCSPFARMKTNERSEEHTSELQSRGHLVCRLLLEKKNSSRRLTFCFGLASLSAVHMVLLLPHCLS